jgi:regulator of sigma E protease
MALTDPASAPALGIAIDVMQTVERVLPGSAADKAGIRAGDQIVSAQLIPEEGTKDEEENRGTAGIGKPIEFEPKKARWPAFFGRLQTTLPGTTVKLKVKRDDEIIDIEDALALEPVPDHYVAERGFLLESMERERKAESLGEALGYGTEETFRALTAVYRFLHKLGRKPEAATHMSGPIGIAQIAGIHAKKGTAMFLIFLTLISANLAVINFLPIPVLDGGHMVFLTLEAIMRRPVSEHVAAIFQWVGLLLLLSLMIFVFTLDISRLIG